DALTIFSGLSKCAKYRTIPFAFATFCGLGERSFIVISLIWLYDLLLENIIITCQCGFLISPSGLTSLSCNGLSIQGTCKSSIIYANPPVHFLDKQQKSNYVYVRLYLFFFSSYNHLYIEFFLRILQFSFFLFIIFFFVFIIFNINKTSFYTLHFFHNFFIFLI